MIKMILSPVVALTLLAFSASSHAAEAKWLTDYQAALKEAKAGNKPILADFTGSDWCGWCMKLDKETFSKPAFANYAKNHVVLLEVDFPRGKPQSEAEKKQNQELGGKFKVDGFPTLVLIDSEGNEIARHVGYLDGGPAAMIAWIKEETAKK